MPTDPIRHPASLPAADLLAELDKRAAATRDQPPGTSRQVCPRCSTVEEEVFGFWHRSTSRFHGGTCGIRLRGDGYERALKDFQTRRWRQRRDARAIRELLKETRR